MRTYDIIQKKRDGLELTSGEINFLIEGFTKGSIPDYQMAAFTMAVYFQGMNARETADLTMAMVNSGDRIDLSPIPGLKVDKHSTGGVGDKTTIILGPLVAAAGVPVAKMSGRGLGHTGGTIDKLESIPGFNTQLEQQRFLDNVKKHHIAIVGQSGNLTPADKKLYALRDVTATVDSIPLIASSVMSKKLASGANAIVLDVKAGSGAFMKNVEDALALGKAMVDIGTETGRETMAVVSDMNQPLGYAIGNALEIKEAIDTLKGQGPKDLTELCLVLGSFMLQLAGKVQTPDEGRSLLFDLLNNGVALDKFRELVSAQDGNSEVIDNTELLPKARKEIHVVAPRAGFVQEIKTDSVGIAAMILGAGRETKESKIDLSVGIILNKKIGDTVEKGETIAVLHANDEGVAQDASEVLIKAYTISENKPFPVKLIHGIVSRDEVKRIKNFITY